jgi:hypothetical protein
MNTGRIRKAVFLTVDADAFAFLVVIPSEARNLLPPAFRLVHHRYYALAQIMSFEFVLKFSGRYKQRAGDSRFLAALGMTTRKAKAATLADLFS